MAISSPPDATAPITIGTAGHIDHGKTLLVERLTGMRADRPFERERGMTIDIGYAEMAAPDGRRIGFVDLPGHERFVRNMVAGATGIDLALLVVAADDGVMPQTREHLDILGLLGVRRGVVVLNKVDLVDEETRAIALEDLRETLAGTTLADAPILPCSAATGEGVDAVRDALLALVRATEVREDPRAFFLAVQRTFAAAGFGCIVTGVPAAGAVAAGDELELLPGGRSVRVRAIEIYHAPAERARAGHRTALNLAGVHHDEVHRGMVVASPGAFRASRHVAARLRVVPSAGRALRHAGPVRLLTGTLEEMAAVHLAEGDAMRPGDEGLVEIRVRTPVPVLDGAPFIVRSDNAADTIGGGVLVAALEGPLRRRDAAERQRLLRWAAALPDPVARVREALARAGIGGAAAVAAATQLTRQAAAAALADLAAAGELVALPGEAYAAAADVREAAAAVRRALAEMHAANPLVAALPRAAVRDHARLADPMFDAALARLGAEVVEEAARTLRLATHSVSLEPELERAAERLLGFLRDARFSPPPRDELAAAAGLEPARARAAVVLLRDRGDLREVAPGLLYPASVLDEGLRILRRVAQKRGNFEPVDAKAALGGISRKWLIPLLEYYDRAGATRRDGNARHFTRKGEAMTEGGIQ
jgi:selenocysteine-specific elongation factor